jgi:hypothetical protein
MREAKLEMASAELDVRVGESEVEPPRKRQRLSPTPTSKTADEKKLKMDDRSSRLENVGSVSDGREAEVGILWFVNAENPGFEGVLKHRYVQLLFLLLDCFRSIFVMLLYRLVTPLRSSLRSGERKCLG